MKKKYTIELYFDEKLGWIAHEETGDMNLNDARMIISFLEEYKQKLVTYILFNEQQVNVPKKKAKKAE